MSERRIVTDAKAAAWRTSRCDASIIQPDEIARALLDTREALLEALEQTFAVWDMLWNPATKAPGEPVVDAREKLEAARALIAKARGVRGSG